MPTLKLHYSMKKCLPVGKQDPFIPGTFNTTPGLACPLTEMTRIPSVY